MFFKNRCSEKFRSIQWKRPLLESLYNKMIPTQVFSSEYCEIFKNNFFYRTLSVAVSGFVITLKIFCGIFLNNISQYLTILQTTFSKNVFEGPAEFSTSGNCFTFLLVFRRKSSRKFIIKYLLNLNLGGGRGNFTRPSPLLVFP